MSTIETLKKLFRKKAEDVTEKESQLNALRNECQNKKAAAEEAALAGDYDQYKVLSAELKEMETMLYVSEMSLKNTVNTPGFTPEEVKSAWNDYVSSYTKKLNAALADYAKKRKELYEEYMKLVNMQNEAMKVRNDCGQLIGMKAESDEGEKQIMGKFNMPYVSDDREAWQSRYLAYGNCQVQHPDPLFFRACNVCTDEDLDRFNRILRLHQVG